MSSERQLLEEKSPWWGEHIHRYETVIKRLQGTEYVLDIACGTGFGSDLLAEKASRVIGGDIDAHTIEKNKTIWHRTNLDFQKLDATQLPFEEDTFDVLVSFETIEHSTQYEAMLSEFKRVTKKGGLLFISTPNIYMNSPTGMVTNPFHTQEFTPEEFNALIFNQNYSAYELLGQLYARYQNQDAILFKIAHFFETMFYQRGFRKIPISIQDAIMNILIQKTQYPSANDYTWTDNMQEIERKCITQMVVCRK
jgi:2-polyprenyl-3-methyl-5-hydroxy-6-metoxy-1,4-benzoquinol methylase